MESPVKSGSGPSEENDNFLQIQDSSISNENIKDLSCFVRLLSFCHKYLIDTRRKIYDFIRREENCNQCYKVSDETMYRRCLCDTIYPIIILAQLVGVIPLTLRHPKSEDESRTGDCLMGYRWRSFGSIINILLIICFLTALPFAYAEIRDRIGAIFQGTDLYAFTFQTLAILVQTTGVLITGRVKSGKFSKGWEILNAVFHEMCDSAGDLTRIKVASYVVTIIMIMESICFAVFNFWTYINAAGVFKTCMSIYVGTAYIELSTVIPYILSSGFFFICLLIRSNFLKIAAMIKTVVAKPKNPKLAAQIDSLRILHELLCTAVTCFEDFFGLQVLLTLCVCCFTVTTGAYAVILQGEGISSQNGKEMTAAWGTQLYCAMVFILLILVAGQLVSNSASASAPVLNAIPLTDLDEPTQKQVTAFLHKISAFPVKMSAMKITTISTTFLASAATNITTYLLVLMQFKLTIEGKPSSAPQSGISGGSNSILVVMDNSTDQNSTIIFG